jgi:chromosomal replication initiator protein
LNPHHREVFDGAKDDLVQALGRKRFHLWFRDVAVERVSGRKVTLAVPTDVHRTWLEFNYREILDKAFSRVLGDGVTVEVTVSERLAGRREVRDRLPADERAWAALLAERRVRPTLVGYVGDVATNGFAARLLGQAIHGRDGGPRAARGDGVEDGAAGVSAGPVLLYGPAGSGKTHLLRATHDALERRAPGSSVLFTARELTSRFVGAIRSGEPHAVRAFEAGVEARRFVLLDALEGLEGRPGTQRELDVLLDRAGAAGARFVLASREHPRDLGAMSERLASRLLGGVVVRLEAPDREGVERILTARASAYGVVLPEEVRAAILERAPGVHAAVEWLDRWAVLAAGEPGPLGAEWLGEIAPPVPPATAREEIVTRAKDLVASHYGVRRSVLDHATKHPSAVLPRRIAMYLVYRAASLPLKELGKAFGLRSHSAVSRAIHEVRAQRETDPTVEVVVDGLLRRL